MVGLVSNSSLKASAKPQSAEVGKLDLFEGFYSLTTQPAQAGFAILATVFNPLLSLSAENNLGWLYHKTFTKNLDFSHYVRK